MILLKTSQAQLLAALLPCLGVVERRHTVPVLANLLIRKTGARIEFTGSDLTLQTRSHAQLGAGDSDFATTVNARKLADMLRAMPPDQTVTLGAQQNKLSLQGGGSRFTVQTLPAGDFPLVADAADAAPEFGLPQAVLKALIDQVAFAMAAHDVRYFLNGLLFIADGTELTLVATDGNRLALAQATLATALPRQEVILPRKTVHELQRLLRDHRTDTPAAGAEALVFIRFGGTQARIRFDAIELVSTLIEGRFPDYRRVLPVGHREVVTLGRAALLASLQRAAILASEKFRAVRLQLAPGTLRVMSSNADHEESNEDLAVDYDGAGLEIGFNIAYLTELLAGSTLDRVQIELKDGGASALFSFPERPGFRYVVSPMRI